MAKPVQIDTWPAYVVRYTEEAGDETAHMHFLWVTIEKYTYKLIAGGAERYIEDMKFTAQTLRPMTEKERQSITGLRLRVAIARAGETLADLGKRTGNHWSPAYTAMINHIPEDQKLEAGRLIKIIKEEPYKAKQEIPSAQ